MSEEPETVWTQYRETAITLPTDIVERLLALAMQATAMLIEHPEAEDIAAIKVVDRELRQVREMVSGQQPTR